MAKTLKVILTEGLPGSGKSTWAKKLQDESACEYKRINKDDLRAMLDNSFHSGGNEKFILKVRDMLIETALAAGKNVIVDDTNINPIHIKHITSLVNQWSIRTKIKVDVEIKSFMDVPLEECIKRDLARPKSVGPKVIEDMWYQYQKNNNQVTNKLYQTWMIPDPKLPQAIICDIDGTLALKSDARGVYQFEKADLDEVSEPIKELIKHYFALQYKIIIVSAREDKYQAITEKWLGDKGVPYDLIYMRKSGDKRKDSECKEEIYRTHIEGRYNIRFVVDDRARVCNDTWRKHNLLTLQVAEGLY